MIEKAYNEYAEFFNKFFTEFEHIEIDDKTEEKLTDVMKDMMELKTSFDKIMRKSL